MKKLFSNKLFILVMVTLLIVAIIAIDSHPSKPLQNVFTPISAIIKPVQNFFGSVGDRMVDFSDAVSKGMELKDENEELRARVAALENEMNLKTEAAQRWEELKDVLHIRDRFEKYDFYNASVLTRESDEWFSMIRVDSGRTDGIYVDESSSLAVIDVKSNLVGRVLSTESSASKILPLLHESFSVSAKVDKINGATVQVHGEAGLKLQGLCKVDQIPADNQLVPGDVLVTSGEGGLFPPGIKIGTIVSVEEESTLSSYAALKPEVNIAELKDVIIMIESKSDQIAIPAATD